MQILCRRCTSDDLRPSASRILDYPLRLFLLRPVRCHCCYLRQWKPFWRVAALRREYPGRS